MTVQSIHNNFSLVTFQFLQYSLVYIWQLSCCLDIVAFYIGPSFSRTNNKKASKKRSPPFPIPNFLSPFCIINKFPFPSLQLPFFFMEWGNLMETRVGIRQVDILDILYSRIEYYWCKTYASVLSFCPFYQTFLFLSMCIKIKVNSQIQPRNSFLFNSK